MPPPPIIDPSKLDLNTVIADKEAIRKAMPHRGHMEHLTAVVYVDVPTHTIAGYRDIGHDEFWVDGHFPNYPIFPGVLQAESAAQLLAYYASIIGVFDGLLMGLGGLNDFRFRGAVRPGDRLILLGRGVRVSRRQTIFDVQGFVKTQPVFDGQVIGLGIAPYTVTATGAG